VRVAADGQGRADQYAFRHLTGTATVVSTQEYGCRSSVTTSTGSATSFEVFGDHTASAQFAMTGETVQPAWVQTRPETGDMTCGEPATTPIPPWELSIGWWQDPDQPGMDMLCNSVAPCGERVPQSEVYRKGA